VALRPPAVFDTFDYDPMTPLLTAHLRQALPTSPPHRSLIPAAASATPHRPGFLLRQTALASRFAPRVFPPDGRALAHVTKTRMAAPLRETSDSRLPRRRSCPTPPGFAATASIARRRGSRAGGRPTTCRGSRGCSASDAGAMPVRPASAWPRVGPQRRIG